MNVFLIVTANFLCTNGMRCLCKSNIAGLEKNLIPDYPLHKQLSYIRGGTGTLTLVTP